MFGSELGDYVASREICQLAIKMEEDFNNPKALADVYTTWGGLVSIWTDPVKTSRSYFQPGFHHSIEAGDVNIASFAVNLLSATTHFKGEFLD